MTSWQLRPIQASRSVAIGVAFWGLAMLTVRWAGPGEPLNGLFGGVAGGLTFAGLVPVLWVTVWLIRKVAVVTAAQLVPAVVLATVAATFCDAIGLTWTRLYGTDAAAVVLGAAAILWGVGWALLWAYIEARRMPSVQ